MKLHFASGDAVTTVTIEDPPTVAHVKDYASEVKIRCGLRLEHMVAAKKRRTK